MSSKVSRSNNTSVEPKVYVSKSLRFDVKNLEKKFYRADLEFYGIDHSGPSYEGRVFVNNPQANRKTPKTFKNGYFGSFYIFGHGGCFGDLGHCEIKGERRPYDLRPEHPLTPAYKRLIVTEQLKKMPRSTNEFTIYIVPVIRGDGRGMNKEDVENVVNLEKVSIITYNLG
jgi:tyrosinase